MGECTVPLPAQPGPATKCQVPNTEYQLGSAANRASTPKREERAFWGPRPETSCRNLRDRGGSRPSRCRSLRPPNQRRAPSAGSAEALHLVRYSLKFM